MFEDRLVGWSPDRDEWSDILCVAVRGLMVSR